MALKLNKLGRWLVGIGTVILSILSAIFLFKRKPTKTQNPNQHNVAKIKEDIDEAINDKYDDRNITEIVKMMNEQLKGKRKK